MQKQILLEPTKNKVVTVVAFLSITFTLNACGGMGIIAYSEPTCPKPTYKSPLFDPNTRIRFASIDLPEIDMTVRGAVGTTTVGIGPLFITVIPWPPGIYRLIFDRDYTPEPPLPIEIRIAPKSGQVAFNAMKVFLVFDDGRRLFPQGSHGPAPLKTFKLLGSKSLSCDSTGGKTMMDTITIAEPSCLVLIYDAPAIPKESFTLFIEGFSQTAQPIAISPIRFERGSHFDIYPFRVD